MILSNKFIHKIFISFYKYVLVSISILFLLFTFLNFNPLTRELVNSLIDNNPLTRELVNHLTINKTYATESTQAQLDQTASILSSIQSIINKLKIDIQSLFGREARAQADITTGLVGHWKFDEVAGTTANDSSGNNTGTLTNGPLWTIGKIGGALSFDGVNDYVNAGTTFDISSLPFSISAWVKPSSYADYGTIIAKRASYSPSAMRFDLVLNLLDGRVLLQSATSNLTFSYAPPLNTWTHLVVVPRSGGTDLYVNGVLNNSQNAFILGTGATAQVRIGNASGGPDQFSGSLDDVRIYNRALSQAEITELYNYTGSSVDTTPPVLSSGSPTGALPAGTTQTILSIEATDASSPVSCKYSQTPGTAYSSMIETLSTANGTTFTVTVTGLTNGTSYNYYIRCQDIAGNANTIDYPIFFSVSAPTGDTTPPTVSITSPTNGATVSGTVSVSASASDNVAVAGVQFKLDGANLGAEDTISPYSYSLNTTTITDGSHTLTAIARDTSNNYATSSIITITVNNASPPPPDTTVPSTPTNLISTPISSSQINLSWTASTDNVGVTGYKIYRCAGSVCTPITLIATSPTNSYSDTSLTVSTAYTYAVSAYDAAGNDSGKSASVSTTTLAVTVGGAPSRPGQPYAEAVKCADPNVIFCEDFNYPQNFWCANPFFVGNNNHRWINPGWAEEMTNYNYGCDSRQINPATNYPPQPTGSPQGGYAWVANWDSEKGVQGNGSSWGRLRLPDKNYVNGLPPANDFYIRFQYYVTPDYTWPGDPKIDKYNYGAANPIDNKILFVYPPAFRSPTEASYDAGLFTSFGIWDWQENARFADALALRVGDAGSGRGYEHFPLCSNCSYNPPHDEYGPFQSLTLRNPNDKPILGKIFRFNTGQWYTIEMRYKLGSAPGVKDGTIEVWIDGIKIYSANDLATCGFGIPQDDCSGLGTINLVAYHNMVDKTIWDGQQIIDNLIISKSYIGPLAQGITSSVGSTPPPADSTAPSAPTGLSATVISSSQINLSWNASSDNVGIAGYKIYRCAGSVCAPTTQIATSTINSYSNIGLTASTAYTYAVSAYDSANNESTKSSSVSATTTSADTTPPTVSITSPTSGQTVSGTITVSADASDNVAVSGVQFKLDNANLGAEDTTSPYSIFWNTVQTTNGAHTLLAVARDASGNRATSSPVTITTDNDTTPPTISSVISTTLASTTARIDWQTNEPSTSQVEYGFTTQYGASSTLDSILSTSHSVLLSNLSADNTTYNFRVRSKDSSGNEAISTNYTFITTGLTDIIPPAPTTNLTANNITQTSVDLVTWTAQGDDGSLGTAYEFDIRYTTGDLSANNWNNGGIIKVTGEPTPKPAGSQMSYTLVGLTANTTYKIALKTLDEAGNQSPISNIITFTTLKAETAPAPAPAPSSGGGGGGGGGGGSTSSGGGGGGGSSTISDTTPAPKITELKAQGADQQVRLTWKNPENSDWVRTILVRKAGGFATSTKDGSVVFEGTEPEFTDINLKNNENYYYSLFTIDRTPNYSQPATIMVKTIALKVSLEEIKPAQLTVREQEVLGLAGEAAEIIKSDIKSFLSRFNFKRDQAQEDLSLKQYVKELIKDIKDLMADRQIALNHFIAYGTNTTLKLGAGERAGVVNSYKSAFNKLPTTAEEWTDALKIGNGRWPTERSAESENNATTAFKKIYQRSSDRKNPHDDAAVTVMAYGLRPSNRNLNSERAAIKSFRAIYGYAPKSAINWDIVRAIAYSGARR